MWKVLNRFILRSSSDGPSENWLADGGRENKEKMKLEKRREKFCIKNEKDNFVSTSMKILRDRQIIKQAEDTSHSAYHKRVLHIIVLSSVWFDQTRNRIWHSMTTTRFKEKKWNFDLPFNFSFNITHKRQNLFHTALVHRTIPSLLVPVPSRFSFGGTCEPKMSLELYHKTVSSIEDKGPSYMRSETNPKLKLKCQSYDLIGRWGKYSVLVGVGHNYAQRKGLLSDVATDAFSRRRDFRNSVPRSKESLGRIPGRTILFIITIRSLNLTKDERRHSRILHLRTHSQDAY